MNSLKCYKGSVELPEVKEKGKVTQNWKITYKLKLYKEALFREHSMVNSLKLLCSSGG